MALEKVVEGVEAAQHVFRQLDAIHAHQQLAIADTLSDLGAGACFNDARVEVERA